MIYIEAGLNAESTQQTYYRVIEDILRTNDYRLFRIYEQMHEWIEDSPLLRRVNMAFMSGKFAARHPFHLTRDLHRLRNDCTTLRAEIKVIAAQADAAETRAGELGRALHKAEIDLGAIRAYTREIERKYIDVLQSRTWQVMEPVRWLSRRIARRKKAQLFVPKFAEGGDGSQPGNMLAGGLSVDDLAAKLWGGFSEPARADLICLAGSASARYGDRVHAAWNLARWEAAAGNWDACLSHLNSIANLDKSFFRTRRPRMLAIEAHVRTGDPAKAIEYAEHGLNREPDGNYLCGISNALLFKNPAASAGRERLATLNRIYPTAGLSKLAMIDPAKGFIFGNLTSEAAAPAGADGPKISVLMAVYNAGEFIETAVGSLLAQSWRNLEIAAVDDASTDDSWEKLQRLSARDARLRIFRNETNLGAYPTRNHALKRATGDLITVHDSDDWSHPQMLEVQARALLRAPENKATFSAMARVLPSMEFMLRPERNNLDYVHRSYPSLMMRRNDLALLHQWDGVLANADDELVQRVRAAWG
jgi:hypothetical protein